MLALILIIYALGLGCLVWLSFSKWIIIVILLVFLGGIIVVFIYAVILSPNFLVFGVGVEPFVFVSMVVVIIVREKFQVNGVVGAEFIGDLYFGINFIRIFILTIYLLFILFRVVKVSENFKGAVIKKF